PKVDKPHSTKLLLMIRTRTAGSSNPLTDTFKNRLMRKRRIQGNNQNCDGIHDSNARTRESSYVLSACSASQDHQRAEAWREKKV
ncbi:hypothetical protein PFISCL1PPCAC_26667, partial [Pristionchus fissidentatus]